MGNRGLLNTPAGESEGSDPARGGYPGAARNGPGGTKPPSGREFTPQARLWLSPGPNGGILKVLGWVWHPRARAAPAAASPRLPFGTGTAWGDGSAWGSQGQEQLSRVTNEGAGTASVCQHPVQEESYFLPKENNVDKPQEREHRASVLISLQRHILQTAWRPLGEHTKWLIPAMGRGQCRWAEGMLIQAQGPPQKLYRASRIL